MATWALDLLTIVKMKFKKQMTTSNTKLSIVKYGDPILRRPVEDITDFTSLSIMTDQMFDIMYEEGGIGLAANQVGWSLNLLVLDISNIEDEADSKSYIFINWNLSGKHFSFPPPSHLLYS